MYNMYIYIYIWYTVHVYVCLLALCSKTLSMYSKLFVLDLRMAQLCMFVCITTLVCCMYVSMFVCITTLVCCMYVCMYV